MRQEFSLNGRRVSLSSVGSGPDLVCLPGGPGFPGDQLGDLGGVAGFRTLQRVDWRGAGSSDPPFDGRYGIGDFVFDLAALHGAEGSTRLSLFGHSFGGIVAASYAAAFPDRVGLLILDGTPDRLNDGRAPVGGASGYFATSNDRSRRYLEQTMQALFKPAWTWFEENELQTYDLGPSLGLIRSRTLIITGDQDWAAGPDRCQAMARQIEGSQVAVIPQAGHFAWVEQPDAYADASGAFLS